MFRWQKLGNIFNPVEFERHHKLVTHAANPLAMRLEGDIYRIFYSGRDSNNRSSVGAVDIDITTQELVTNHYEPFFEFGDERSFFSHGVSIGNSYTFNGKTYMLFMGWQNKEGSHWRGDIGRLKVSADLNLQLESAAPFMGVDSEDEISYSYPWVESDDESLEMWYGSTITWRAKNGEMIHVIKNAFSRDGETWVKEGISIPFEIDVAQAFSRPTIFTSGNQRFMWFSFRPGTGKKYDIGFAREIGNRWQLALDEAGIETSDEGWDSEMIEYPFVFEHEGTLYMLYNGNSNGLTGFGLAKLVGNLV